MKGKTSPQWRAILLLAWPAIVTNITTPLLGLVDVAVVGHIGSPLLIAAIALGGAVFNMLYWTLNFLRTGTSGLTSQALGAGNQAHFCATLVRSLAIAAALAAVILLCSPLICTGMLRFMDADSAVQPLARVYFLTAVWGAPAVLAQYALSGWFVGMQDTRPILIMALVTNLVNISLNLIFVFIFHLDLQGVAAATATGQWAGLLTGAVMCRRFVHRRGYRLPGLRRAFSRALGSRSRLFKVNSDIFLRTVCLVAVTLWFTRAGSQQGAITLAANSLLLQFYLLFSFFVDGFSFAGEALAGKLYGAGRRDELRVLIRRLMIVGLGLAAIFSVAYFTAGPRFIALLTDSAQVRAESARYIMWIAVLPLCSFAAFIYDGIFIGLTLTRRMLLSMAAAMALFFLLLGVVRLPDPNNTLWFAFNAYLLVRALMQRLLIRL